MKKKIQMLARSLCGHKRSKIALRDLEMKKKKRRSGEEMGEEVGVGVT